MSDTANDTYIAVNEYGTPELRRRTPGEYTNDQPILTREGLRVAMWHSAGEPYSDAYLADVDRLWDAIAATAATAGDDL